MGVGYVISGNYFGWNLGLPEGGPLGLLLATAIVTVMYVAFCLSYAELACAMPRAGGVFVYAREALGARWGFTAGLGQWIEYVFIGPAIARAIGDYFAIFFPTLPPLAIATAAYVLFTALNIYGVRQSAIFELVITALAVVELLIFAGLTLPHFSLAAFTKGPQLSALTGFLPAIPFAIWFYVGIEALANLAEETVHPEKNLPKGFVTAIATLVALALLTFFGAIGVNGWEQVVFKPGSVTPSDSPLPLALGFLYGGSHVLYHLLVTIGLCGLIASFHGILLAGGRATFEFGRAGYLPAGFGRVLASRQTPANALVLNLVVGIVAMFTGKTGEIIVLSIFGALTLIVLAMLSLLVLRRKQPELVRPYRAPFYPWLPGGALVLATFCLCAMTYYNRILALIYLGILGLGQLKGRLK